MLHAYVKILNAKFHTITWLDLVQSTQTQKHILLRLQPSWKKNQIKSECLVTILKAPPIARSESKESGVHGRAYGIWMQAKIKWAILFNFSFAR